MAHPPTTDAPAHPLRATALALLGALALCLGACERSDSQTAGAETGADGAPPDAEVVPAEDAPRPTAEGDLALPESDAEADPERALRERLAGIRRERRVPGIGAAIVRGDAVEVLSVAGFRAAEHPETIQPADSFHIGSCTKAMTATVAAMLVDEGSIRWDTTIGGVFPELRGQVDDAYLGVTLEQLLAHTAGIPNDPGYQVAMLRELDQTPGSGFERRNGLVPVFLSQGPASTPGERYAYSNFGYLIAAAMIEEMTQRSWEYHMIERLFEPLGMRDSAGFGPPGTMIQVVQPRGHSLLGDKLASIPASPAGDNPVGMGPAGKVHCSLMHWGAFASMHLRAARGEDVGLVSPESAEALHRPRASMGGADAYALGWIVTERPWAGGRALTHSGSNTFWYATVWIAPERNLALLAATNAGGARGQGACDDAIVAMIDLFASQGE